MRASYLACLLILGLVRGAVAGEDLEVRQQLAQARNVRDAGNHDEAIRRFQQVIEAAQKAGQPDLEHQARIGLVGVHDARYDDLAVRDELVRILALEERLGRMDAAAISRIDLGERESRLGNHDRAVDLLRRAGAHVAGQPGGEAALLAAEVDKRLGMALLEVGLHARALERVSASEAVFAGAADALGHAECLKLLGSIHRDLGSYEIAQKTLERAGDVAGADHRGLQAAIQANLGNVEFERGGIDLGIERMMAAAAVFAELGDEDNLARTRHQIGTAHFRAGRLDAAVKFFSDLLKDDAGNSAPVCARARLLRGQVLLAAGKLPAARRDLLDARAAGHELRSAELVAGAEIGLARWHLASGAPETALAHVRAALAQIRYAIGGLAPLLLASARGAVERVDAYTTGIEAAAALRSPPDTYEMIERARAAALRRSEVEPLAWGRGITEADRTLVRVKRERVVAARRRYDRAARAGRLQRLKAASAALDRALAEHARAIDMLYGFPPATPGGEPLPIVPAARVREMLKAGEVLCLYSLVGRRACALVMRPNGMKLVDLGPSDAIHTALAPAGRAEDPARAWAGASAALQEALIEPLALGPADHRLLIVPDGPMARVPLGLLLPKREACWLPSASVFHALRGGAGTRGQGALVYAAPDYTRSYGKRTLQVFMGLRRLEPLPAALVEAAHVPGHPRLQRDGAAATESSFRVDAASRPRWRIMHFGCHGVTNDRLPGRSALALTPSDADDGFLTARELLALPFAADLVVLSSCSSARAPVAPHEGLLGLPHAFLYRGARHVVASHWDVEDKSTARLMEAFYKARKEGASVIRALRTAQAHVQTLKPAWKEVAYWAAWDVWGLPD